MAGCTLRGNTPIGQFFASYYGSRLPGIPETVGAELRWDALARLKGWW